MADHQEPKKIRRPAFTYCIQHKAEADIRVLHGNRIVSRHATAEAARAALDAILKKPLAA